MKSNFGSQYHHLIKLGCMFAAIGLIVWLISPWLPPTEKHASTHQYLGIQVHVTTVNDWKFSIFITASIICVVVYLLLNAKNRSKR